MTLVQTRRSLVLAALLALAGTLHAAPPEIEQVAPYLPPNTRFVGALHMTTEVRDWILNSFTYNPETYKRVVTEQAQQFAKVTGFDPMNDVEWMVVAFADPKNMLMAVQLKTDTTKAIAALKADPKTAKITKLETFKGATLVSFPGADVALIGKYVLVGISESLRPILDRAAPSPTNANLLAQVTQVGPLAYLAVLPTADYLAGIAKNPQAAQFGGAILARLKLFTVGIDSKQLLLAFKLDSKDAATVAADQIKGLLTTAKGVMETSAKAIAVPADASPFQHLDPKVILGRVGAATASDALAAATVTADGEVARVALPREKIPLLRGDVGTLLVLTGAIGGGAYAATRLKNTGVEEQAQCFANQQRLTGALELYRSDKKKPDAKLEDVADELVTTKYLESKPDDPGQPAGTFKNYRSTSDGRVSCTVHGAPEAPTTPATPTRDAGADAPAAGTGGAPAKPSPAASPKGDDDDEESGKDE